MPLPSTRVFHRDWEAHHRPVAEGAMTGSGYFTRASTDKVFNTTTGKSTYAAPTAVYGSAEEPVPLRVVRDGVDTTVAIGQREVTKRSYLVTVPVTAPELRAGDEVHVVAAGDPHLPGEPLWVTDVRFGTQVWERDLICDNVPPQAG